MHCFLGFCPCMPLLSFSNSLTTTYLHTIILTQNSMSREHLYLLNKYVSRYYSIPFTIPLQPFSPRHFPPAIFPPEFGWNFSAIFSPSFKIWYYRIGCVSTRFGLLHALAYYAQHNCDFIMTIIMRSGLLRAFGL